MTDQQRGMNYEQLHKGEAFGAFAFGIDIRIASPVNQSENVRRATRKAAELLEQAIIREFYATDQDEQERAKAQRISLLSCFSAAPIFVKPIPNGYCSRACCEHLPWFQVTTAVGDIVIGWRKSVIVVDWSGSAISNKADDLFPSEDVTKYDRLIHAWGYDKAKEYVTLLLSKESNR